MKQAAQCPPNSICEDGILSSWTEGIQQKKQGCTGYIFKQASVARSSSRKMLQIGRTGSRSHSPCLPATCMFQTSSVKATVAGELPAARMTAAVGNWTICPWHKETHQSQPMAPVKCFTRLELHSQMCPNSHPNCPAHCQHTTVSMLKQFKIYRKT